MHVHIYIRTAPEKGIDLISTLEIMIRSDTLGIGKFEFGRSAVCGLEALSIPVV